MRNRGRSNTGVLQPNRVNDRSGGGKRKKRGNRRNRSNRKQPTQTSTHLVVDWVGIRARKQIPMTAKQFGIPNYSTVKSIVIQASSFIDGSEKPAVAMLLIAPSVQGPRFEEELKGNNVVTGDTEILSANPRTFRINMKHLPSPDIITSEETDIIHLVACAGGNFGIYYNLKITVQFISEAITSLGGSYAPTE